VPRRTLPPEATRAISAAVARGAISEARVPYWANQVLAAASPADADGIIAVIDVLAGNDGRTAATADLADDPMFASLWPPKDGAEADRRAKLAASAAGAWTDDQVYEAIFSQAPSQ
jgi:hypothetical protein